MEVLDVLSDDEPELGISPIGSLLVVLLGFIGIIFFLDPRATTFDYRVAGIITISIALAAYYSEEYEILEDEGDLPRTFLLALIGASVVSIMVTAVYAVPFQDTLTFSTIIVLGLPPIFEELAFRLGLFLAFQKVTGTTMAIGLQALVFATYHFIFWEVSIQYAIVLFFGGIVFQLIFLLSKNLLSSMLAHAIVNLRPFIFAVLMSPFVILAVAGGLLITIWRRSRNGD